MQYVKRISLLLTEYPHTNAHVHYIKTNNRLPLHQKSEQKEITNENKTQKTARRITGQEEH